MTDYYPSIKEIFCLEDDTEMNQNYENICNICLSNIDKDDKIIKLSCNHIFHKKCLKLSFKANSWNNSFNECPYCRKRISKFELNNMYNINNKTKELNNDKVQCNGINMTGINKGKQCLNMCNKSDNYCKKHIKTISNI